MGLFSISSFKKIEGKLHNSVKETQSSLSRSKWASSLEWIPLLFNATIVLGNPGLAENVSFNVSIQWL
jgi:hypothetical protein